MPVYTCYCGACDNAALLEEGCFILRDRHGCEWFCFDTGLTAIHDGALGEHVAATTTIQAALQRAGFRGRPQMAMVDCADRRELLDTINRDGKPRSLPTRNVVQIGPRPSDN